jgi:gliding motility-associated-like protein
LSYSVIPIISAFFTSIAVYNRWGERVFTTTDPLKGWDGKVKGSSGELGAYMYSLRFSLGEESKVYNMKGDVTLIR